MKNHKEHGFTLIELMVTIVMLMLVLAAGYVYFLGSQRASTQQAMIAEMQDNARMAMDVIAQNSRMTGFLIDFNKYASITDGLNSVSTKVVHMNNTGLGSSDQIITVASGSQQIGTLQADALRGDTTFTFLPDTGVTISPGSILGVGYASTVVVESVTDSGGNKIVTLNSSTPLQADCPGPKPDPPAVPTTPGTPVFQLSSLPVFEIETDASSGKPVLYMGGPQPQPLAENIEDLQIEYGVDRNDNDTISADEWTSIPSSDDLDLVRLIRITVVARTDREVQGFEKQIPHIDVADHTWNQSDPAYKDGYQRFMLQRVVKCRNMARIASIE